MCWQYISGLLSHAWLPRGNYKPDSYLQARGQAGERKEPGRRRHVGLCSRGNNSSNDVNRAGDFLYDQVEAACGVVVQLLSRLRTVQDS